MKLNGRLSRIDNSTHMLTGHYEIAYWRHYIRFFKVYGDLADDIVEVPFNELDLKGRLFRPLKLDPKNGYWK